ncbi:MAG: hypothetical protein J0L63_14000 [Anaerolineae bacterium]|nr:hypothetical protein [Anaerolineae bacterium]MBN8620017.1 hypothetical protein [Anaerolineae bacterium]
MSIPISRSTRYLLITVVILGIIVCVLFISSRLLGNNLSTNIDNESRKVDIRTAEAKMSDLVDKIKTNNSDTFLETGYSNPIRLLTGQPHAGCIRGNTQLIYKSGNALEAVATKYANFFKTQFVSSKVNNEAWYKIAITAQSEILLSPLTAPSISECSEPNACYEIGIYYGDPSVESCSGG